MRRLASLVVMIVAFAGLATLPTLPALAVYVTCMLALFKVRRPLDAFLAAEAPEAVRRRSRAMH